MAKNWKVGEAVKAIQDGNKEDVMDIGKRFPLFARSASTVKEDDLVMDILNSIPERVSVRVIETALKDGVVEASDEDEDEAVEEKADDKKADKKQEAKADKKSEKTEKKAEAKGGDDYEKMGAYPLYLLCKERGLEVKSKQPKDVYLEALREADGGADEADDEEAGTDYSKMSAQELFKECKARGIEVEPKKKPAYYIEKLEADDESGEGEDDDWGEDEADEKEEKKADKKADKKSDKKADKKKDDDDDWDI